MFLGLARHFGGGKLAQFIVNQRKQFIGGAGIATINCFENTSNFAHS
jgi:hypothetical protein